MCRNCTDNGDRHRLIDRVQCKRTIIAREPMKKLVFAILLIASPAWAQVKLVPRNVATRADPCAPIGQTADHQLVYSMKCDNLPAPPAPPPQAEAAPHRHPSRKCSAAASSACRPRSLDRRQHRLRPPVIDGRPRTSAHDLRLGGLPRFAKAIPLASAAFRIRPAFFKASTLSGPGGIDRAASNAASASASRSRSGGGGFPAISSLWRFQFTR